MGATTLRASAPGISETTATVDVTPAPPINVGNATIGDDLQQQINGILSVAAPAGGVVVTITSNDPARLLLSTSPTAIGAVSININVNAGSTFIAGIHLQALDSSGTVDFTTAASGYSTDTSKPYQHRRNGGPLIIASNA